MKKLFAILASLSLSITGATMLVACANNDQPTIDPNETRMSVALFDDYWTSMLVADLTVLNGDFLEWFDRVFNLFVTGVSSEHDYTIKLNNTQITRDTTIETQLKAGDTLVLTSQKKSKLIYGTMTITIKKQNDIGILNLPIVADNTFLNSALIDDIVARINNMFQAYGTFTATDFTITALRDDVVLPQNDLILAGDQIHVQVNATNDKIMGELTSVVLAAPIDITSAFPPFKDISSVDYENNAITIMTLIYSQTGLTFFGEGNDLEYKLTAPNYTKTGKLTITARTKVCTGKLELVIEQTPKIDLSQLPVTDLGSIFTLDAIPSLNDLLTQIRSKNSSNDYINLFPYQVDLIGEATATTATIQAKDNSEIYTGQVTLTYTLRHD